MTESNVKEVMTKQLKYFSMRKGGEGNQKSEDWTNATKLTILIKIYRGERYF